MLKIVFINEIFDYINIIKNIYFYDSFKIEKNKN